VVQAPHLQSWAPQFWPLAAGWAPLVSSFLSAPEGQRLGQFITERLQTGAVIYPPQPFRALALTPLTEVKVLILGQDPYHGPAQAQGLAFSVSPGTRVPPSLRNILKERARDLGPSVGPGPVDSLESWARQGVLLLNTCLSVEQGRPASHANQGWEVLTHSIVQALADSAQPRVFMLWGAHAQAFAGLISARHLVLTANHPSPLSASRPPQPFIGCGHFSAANAWLLDHQEKAIVW
jgi:uracil-DNA glycosylase